MPQAETSELLQDTILGDQIDSEIEAIEKGVIRYRKLAREAIERGEGAGLKPAERMVLHWMPYVRERITQEKRAVRAGDPGPGRAAYGPVLLCLDTDRLGVLAVHTMLSRCMSEPSGDLVSRMAYTVGQHVIAEIHHDMLRRNSRATLRDLDKRFKRLSASRVNWWAKRTLDEHLWSRKVCVQLGTRIMWCVIEVANSRPYGDEFHLAFHHEKQWRDNQLKGCVRLDDEVFAVIEEGHLFRQSMRPRYLPMIMEPCAWSKDIEGGYIKVRTPLLSKPTAEQEDAIARSKDMDRVYDALNAINSMSWSINTKVLDVMKQLWDKGGGLIGIPSRENLPMPRRMPGMDDDLDILKTWKSEAHDVHSRNCQLKGDRIGFIQKMNVADRMSAITQFFLPHQMDFRGRCYPIPLYLHQQSDDISRSLLLAGKAVTITERGLYWMKVHTANMAGMDKLRLDDRVAWVDDNRRLIEETANSPLDRLDWMKADEPGQFLAACMAFYDDDMAERLLAQVDGSMNGLQHLGAAGRCEVAGAAVNLLPTDAPNDVYLDVLGVVEDVVKHDSARHNEIARIVMPHLGRDLVKQPVMTSVYGVTRFGARDQVLGRLKKIGIDREYQFRAANYLSGLILDGIGEVCGLAAPIFEWMRECARAMCDHDKSATIMWTAPSGLPVVQPYRNFNTTTIKTCLQHVTLAYQADGQPISKARQVQGLPPNVVHTWDGTHNMGTAIRSVREKLAFASVHDSYWSHCSSMDLLGKILREEFVSMHTAPLLLNLKEEWEAQRPGLQLPAPPPPGKLDLSQVIDSTYFFA